MDTFRSHLFRRRLILSLCVSLFGPIQQHAYVNKAKDIHKLIMRGLSSAPPNIYVKINLKILVSNSWLGATSVRAPAVQAPPPCPGAQTRGPRLQVGRLASGLPPSPLSGGAWNQPGPAGGLSKATHMGIRCPCVFSPIFLGPMSIGIDLNLFERKKRASGLRHRVCRMRLQASPWPSGRDRSGLRSSELRPISRQESP